MADCARHRAQKEPQPVGDRVDRLKNVFAVLDLVLRLARLQRFAERTPEWIAARVPQLEVVPDVTRFGAVQIEIALVSVRVTFVQALEHPQRYERIKKVRRATRMESEPRLESLSIQWSFGEFAEESELDRTEKHLRRHEPESGLLDPICSRVCAHRLHLQDLN